MESAEEDVHLEAEAGRTDASHNEDDPCNESEPEEEDQGFIPDSHPSTPEPAQGDFSQAALEMEIKECLVSPIMLEPSDSNLATNKPISSVIKPEPNSNGDEMAIIPSSPTSSLSLFSELSCEDLPFLERKELAITQGILPRSLELRDATTLPAQARMSNGHARKLSDTASILSGPGSVSSSASGASKKRMTGTSPRERRLSNGLTHSQLPLNSRNVNLRPKEDRREKHKREKDKAGVPIYQSEMRSTPRRRRMGKGRGGGGEEEADSDSSSSGVEVSSVSPKKITIKPRGNWKGKGKSKVASTPRPFWEGGVDVAEEDERDNSPGGSGLQTQSTSLSDPLELPRISTRTRVEPCSREQRSSGTVKSKESFEDRFKQKKILETQEEPVREVFVPLSTSTTGPKMSATEIVAAMRARTMAKLGLQPEESENSLDAPMLLEQAAMAARGLNGATRQHADDDDDELDDPSLLIKSSREYKPPTKASAPAVSPARRSSRNRVSSSTKPSDIESAPPSSSTSRFVRAVDKSKFSLGNLHRSKAAEEERGWYGIDEAARAEDISIAEAREPESDYDHPPMEDDSDASLPDLAYSTANGSSSAGPSGGEPKERVRRASDGAFKRLADALGKEHEDAFEAVKIANSDLEHEDKQSKERAFKEERRFWKTNHPMLIEPYEPYDTEGRAGYDLALRKAIKIGLADPASFPVSIFSFFMSSPAAIESAIPVTYSLFHLIAHPNTDLKLANKVLPILLGLLRKMPKPEVNDTDVELSNLVEALHKLGARSESFEQDLRESAGLQNLEMEDADNQYDLRQQKETFKPLGRKAACFRLLALMKVLVETRRCIPEFASSIALLLIKLALDPDDSALRIKALEVLHLLVGHLSSNISVLLSLRICLLRFLLNKPKQYQLYVLDFFPWRTQLEKTLVRSTCFICLFGMEGASENTLEDPTTTQIREKLFDASTSSVFQATPENDDEEIFYSILMLQLVLSDISVHLLRDAYTTDEATIAPAVVARDNVDAIVSILQRMESRMRSHVRSGDPMRDKAKNAFTRLQHALEYQNEAARKRVKKANMDRKQNRGIEHKAGLDGQMSIAGFLQPLPNAVSEQSASEV